MNRLLRTVAVTISAMTMVAVAAETQMVEGRGVGANRAEALKDAYRDAIERAVGMYVDAKQQMKNEELVEDQILTHSKAYIEKYDVVKEKTKPNGLVEIWINAEVKKSALTKKLSDVMPKQTFALGDDAQNIHSRVVTKEKRNVDAAALLENVLKDVDPVKQLMKLSLADTKPLMRETGGDGMGRIKPNQKGKERTLYRFRFTIDEQKYFGDFLPPLVKVLDQIALKPPKNIRLAAVPLFENAQDSRTEQTKQIYLDGKWEQADDVNEDGSLRGISGLDGYNFDTGHSFVSRGGVYIGDIGFADGIGAKWCFSLRGGHGGVGCAQRLYDHVRSDELAKGGFFRAMVITKMNKARTVITAREYALPPECAGVVAQWYDRICKDATTTYDIVFTDNKGDEISSKAVSFVNMFLANVFVGKFAHYDESGNSSYRQSYAASPAMFISPMVHCDAAAFERWIAFDIPRDELPNIKSVTVELAE